MHVSVTLTATSHVRIDDDEEVPVSVSATSADEADPPDWVPNTAALAPASSARIPRGSAHTEPVSPGPDTTASSKPSPAACLRVEDPTEEGPVREGMYGPMHWLDDRHVTALLSPYICEGWDTGDYARFADLSGTDARRLRSLLPPLARSDRQNNAPRIADLLRAATRIDGLTLEGYVIRAPRWDERVSIDTVCVPESAIIAHTGRPIDDSSYPAYQHWLTLADVLGLGDDAIPPDEMRILTRDATATRWWWAWWD